jgi:chromosome partitioning protein
MAPRTGKILVAATSKGGAGKSTMVACLATYWQGVGKRVALVDADPNETLSRWHGKRGALSGATLHVEHDENAIIPVVRELAGRHDAVLVDCAGFGNQCMVFAIGAADLVLIPVMTDEANVFEAVRTRRLVESASAMINRPIAARSVLSRVKRTAVASHARAQLVSLQTPPLAAQLNDRALFQEATFHGSSPTALAPSSEAARDVVRLAEEIEGLLWVRAPRLAAALAR